MSRVLNRYLLTYLFAKLLNVSAYSKLWYMWIGRDCLVCSSTLNISYISCHRT